MGVIQARYIGNDSKAVALLATAREALSAAEAKSESLITITRGKLAGQIREFRSRVRKNAVKRLEQTAAQELIQKLTECEERSRAAILDAHHDCLELIREIATEVIGTEIKADSRSLVARIERGIRSLLVARGVRVFVSPSEADAIKQQLINHHELQIVPDDTVPIGIAVVETSSGVVRVNWQEHLSGIIDMLHTTLVRQLNQVGSLCGERTNG